MVIILIYCCRFYSGKYVIATDYNIHVLSHRYNKKTKERVNVPIPKCIQIYNSSMGGVDLSDMLVELYRVPTRARRWYFAIIGYLLDLAVVNSWLVYRRHGESLGVPAKLSSKDFRLSISKALRNKGQKPQTQNLGRIKVIKKPRGHRPDDDTRYDQKGHWPLHEPRQNRCKYCPTGYTSIICSKCEVNLCLVGARNCFVKFHCE